MAEDIRLEGERVLLRRATPDDASERYVRWMNDPEVTRFTEARFQEHTLESVREYIEQMGRDPDTILFAVIDRSDGLHVGNIGLVIDPRHDSGTIGLILGEPERWGRGHATEAISLVSRYAFEELGLGKVGAGCYADNEGSRRAFERAGFVVEGRRRSQRIAHDGSRTDELQLGLVAPER